MKNKIKIMNERQGVTNEELERFKDFDALLVKHRHAGSGGGSNGFVKWSGLSLGGLAIVAFTVYYFNNQEAAIPNDQIQPVVTEPVSMADSVVEEESVSEPATIENEKKPIASTPPENNEQVVDTQPEAETIEKVEPQEEIKREKIYVKAEPVNGYTHLYEYFNRELVYPPTAVQDSLQGGVKVSFVIDKKGVVGNIQFINSPGKLFEEEATRLIQNMPPWKPATLDGEPVLSKMTLPLTFKITEPVKKN